jgi:hypothetical protein
MDEPQSLYRTLLEFTMGRPYLLAAGPELSA